MYRIILFSLIFLFSINCKKKDDDKGLLLGTAILASQSASTGTTDAGNNNNGGTLTFSPTSGSHSNTATNLAITSATSNANIYYTTDGSTPTSSSTLYNAAVHIWFLAGKTVKAIAIKSGIPDSVVATLTGMFS